MELETLLSWGATMTKKKLAYETRLSEKSKERERAVTKHKEKKT